jgi:hypothetical protein
MVLDFFEYNELDLTMLKNKLFCTFTTLENLDTTINEINTKYIVSFKKIFVLISPDSSELMCTYNIEETDKITKIIKNTILVHRKKESNTLYTINSLNALIKSINNGVLDSSFIINWQDYKNCILLFQDQKIKKLNTEIHKIVNLN